MANRKHFAIEYDQNLRPIKTRLWDYFRLNLSVFPELRLKPENAIRTISIKNALKKQGWKVVEQPTEVLIIKPKKTAI